MAKSALTSCYIPYRSWWSSPFCRWQGSLGRSHSIELAAQVTRDALAARDIAVDQLDGVVLGITVPQKQGFYGAPWLANLIGADTLSGPTVSQACATSVRAMMTAALEVEYGSRACVGTICCDRTSNGPHITYPDPGGVGGRGVSEDPVWDNFNADPNTGLAMILTAENVAKAEGITREEQDALTLLRHQQYEDALADDRAFQRRYMVPVTFSKRGKVVKTVDADEGIFPTTAEGLAKLRPVIKGGTVTFGSQTFPGDGNAGMLITDADHAKRLAPDAPATIRVLGFGEARVEKGMMPKAVVPAAVAAMASAGVDRADVAAWKTHNPFAVNDVYFCRELGLETAAVNRYGSPLIWGHPQGPTGLRGVMELVEELIERGGGIGVFSGCAAGDTAMAMVVAVD
jgi:acetyl-CoA acetyltransferase family protein